MAIQRFRSKPPSVLTAEQKVAFVLLLFLGLGGVIFGVQSFGANLSRPVEQQIADYYTGEQYLTQDQRDEQDLEASKTKDTDGDGLVDYDELYVYKTSPYISDSDSDGYSDQEEFFSGNNPNCPIGKTCGFSVSTVDEAVSDTNPAEAFIGGLGAGDVLNAGSVEFNSEADVKTFFEQATLEQIRSALIESGMSEEDLNLIDDETLIAFFNGALDQASLQDLVTPTE